MNHEVQGFFPPFCSWHMQPESWVSVTFCYQDSVVMSGFRWLAGWLSCIVLVLNWFLIFRLIFRFLVAAFISEDRSFFHTCTWFSLQTLMLNLEILVRHNFFMLTVHIHFGKLHVSSFGVNGAAVQNRYACTKIKLKCEACADNTSNKVNER